MGELLMYALSLIALIALGVVISPLAGRLMETRKTLPQQGVVKRDWLPTGRIDFATQINAESTAANNQANLSCWWKSVGL